MFFPTGIELLYFKLAFGKDIDMTIAIAGEKARYPGTTAAAVSVAPAERTTTGSAAEDDLLP